MDGNQGPEVVPAGHGDTGFGRAARGPAAFRASGTRPLAAADAGP